jgi:hypothetical protein
VGAVGLAEQDEPDGMSGQTIGRREEAFLGGDATENEVGVFGVRWQEMAGGFDRGMDRLDGDLRDGQVPADQDVRVRDLGERRLHECFSSAPS